MKYFIYFCFSLFIFNCLIANKLPNNSYLINDSVIAYFQNIKKAKFDSEKLHLNNKVITLFNIELQKPESYTNSFDTLKNIGKTYSPDNKFRIFTWNISLLDGSHNFFGIIQKQASKNNKCETYILSEPTLTKIPNLNHAIFNVNSWLGALYYEIIPQKINNTTIYTLLGLRYNNMFTTKKIIESFYFTESGIPTFGFPFYWYDNKLNNRIIFEYSIYVSMVLTYNFELKLLVFDHLSPDQPIHAGDYKYYGPDFTYDALKFENEKWILIPNIIVNNPKPKKKK